MNKIQIEKDEYETWAKNTFIQYASCNISYPGKEKQRLIFGVYVGGGFKVSLGDETLYEGGSFSRAQNEFNSVL